MAVVEAGCCQKSAPDIPAEWKRVCALSAIHGSTACKEHSVALSNYRRHMTHALATHAHSPFQVHTHCLPGNARAIHHPAVVLKAEPKVKEDVNPKHLAEFVVARQVRQMCEIKNMDMKVAGTSSPYQRRYRASQPLRTAITAHKDDAPLQYLTP